MPKKKQIAAVRSAPPQLAKSVDEHIERLGDWRAEIIQALRELIKSTVPKVEEHFRWGQPVYELNGPFCFIKVYRNQVNFGFWRGDQLADPKQLLSKSADRMRSVKLTDVSEIHPAQLRDLIMSAAKLNRESGDPTGEPVAHFHLVSKKSK